MRPNTPDFKFENPNEIEENDREISNSANERIMKQKQAVVMLQRLLRGRAEQNDMFRGKEMRLDLI